MPESHVRKKYAFVLTDNYIIHNLRLRVVSLFHKDIVERATKIRDLSRSSRWRFSRVLSETENKVRSQVKSSSAVNLFTEIQFPDPRFS